MKRFWLCVFVSAAIGIAVAWAINYQKFAHRTARFGPFTMDGEITPASLVASIQQQEASGLARVEVVGGSVHDFGMMAPGDEGEHTFVIKNAGKEDLRLRLGASTCKCTLGELDQDSVSPGEQTEVTLSWTTKEGETDFKQSAQLLTNDPQQVAINLEIHGKVIRDVDIVPESWTFGEVATGEPIEITGTIYNFMKHDIVAKEVKFSSEEMNDLADIEVEEFTPAEESDGFHAAARQAFRVTARIKPGMRQGAVSQNLVFAFQRLDDNGEVIPPEAGDTDPNDYIYAQVQGRIVGSLGMILSSKLSGQIGGGYIYDFGQISPEDPVIAKAFVVLKGSERDNTNLRIGETDPGDVVKARLGEPKGRGTMKLYPLEIELVPGSETIERMGSDKDDYGSVWIESDNPKVTKMRIALKFSLEGR